MEVQTRPGVDLSKVRFGGQGGVFLEIEELDLSPYAIVGVLGEASTGKSILLGLVAGVFSPLEGHVRRVLGAGVLRPHWSVGYYPENFLARSDSQVLEYLHFHAGSKGIPLRKSSRSIEDLLEKLNLRPKAQKRIGQLSFCERTLVSIVQAFIGDPPIIVLDEPFRELNLVSRGLLRQVIIEASARALVIFSTRRTEDLGIADGLVTLNDGKLDFSGSCSYFDKNLFQENSREIE